MRFVEHHKYFYRDLEDPVALLKGQSVANGLRSYWTYEDGRTHKEERRKLAGERYVRFSFAKADGMKPGKYNAQIDVNMVPVGITDFVIK